MPSLLFNIKFLPLRQALTMPILIYKGKITVVGGVKICNPIIRFGMIKLGFPTSAVYPNSGIRIENKGELAFKGKCRIGNDSSIVCGCHGSIEFGDNFIATAGLKVLSVKSIVFGKDVLVGWENTFTDDTHATYFTQKTAAISIGNNNWFAMRCFVMPGVSTSDNCVFGAMSEVSDNIEYQANCLYGGEPIRMLSRDVMRIVGKDSIKDYSKDQ